MPLKGRPAAHVRLLSGAYNHRHAAQNDPLEQRSTAEFHDMLETLRVASRAAAVAIVITDVGTDLIAYEEMGYEPEA